VIFPIGDSPNPEGTPYVTYALIAINVAVYVLILPLSWTAPDPTDPSDPIPPCPDCGEPTVLRNARTRKTAGSPFWGCSNYPDCKGIVKL